MKFRNIPFVTVSSNNHASPNGALPFLLPAASSASPLDVPSPVSSPRIQRWAQDAIAKRKGKRKNSNLSDEQPKREAGAEVTPFTEGSTHADPSDMRYEAYMSLLDHRIRNAYVGFPSPFKKQFLIHCSPSSTRSTSYPLILMLSPSHSTSLLALQIL